MAPRTLIQMVQDRLALDNQITEKETKIAVECDGDECTATIAHEVEGKIRLFKVTSKEIGFLEAQ